MKSPVSVALAGAGGYGALYLDALLDDARAEQVRLVGVVEPRSQACPRLNDLRRRGCAVHATLQSLFDSVTPDLLVIAAPTHFHARMTCAALARVPNARPDCATMRTKISAACSGNLPSQKTTSGAALRSAR